MGRLVNVFSWSRSRDVTFNQCARRYWFNYYGHWGGWEHGCDPRTRRIYVLKQLANRWMWAGSLVHDHLAMVLMEMRDGRLPERSAVIERTIQAMRDGFRSSRSGFYQQRPKTTALMEHHYGADSDDIDWVEVRDHVSACMDAFFDGPFPQTLEGLAREDWLAIEDIGHFDFEGTKIWAVPDLAYRTDDTVVIVDWKTGRRSRTPDPIQLACYALYATDTWGVPPETVKTIEVNLGLGTAHEESIDEARLEVVRNDMRESIGKMVAMLRDVKGNGAVEEDFPRTEDRRTCGSCPFQETCLPDSPIPDPLNGAGDPP